MNFKDAVNSCHVRSSIYRTGNSTRNWTSDDVKRCNDVGLSYDYEIGDFVPNRYPKNHFISLEERVPLEDQYYDDWEEYDPRDDDSFYMPG